MISYMLEINSKFRSIVKPLLHPAIYPYIYVGIPRVIRGVVCTRKAPAVAAFVSSADNGHSFSGSDMELISDISRFFSHLNLDSRF